MTEHQLEIMTALGIKLNSHLKYSDDDLIMFAVAACKKYPAKHSLDYFVKPLLYDADNDSSRQEFLACLEQVKRWESGSNVISQDGQLGLL